MGRTQYVRGHYRNGHYVSAHVRNDMGPTPQWVWNLFIGIGALTGLILFASAISYESSSNKEVEQIQASREPDYEGPYGLESWQKKAHNTCISWHSPEIMGPKPAVCGRCNSLETCDITREEYDGMILDIARGWRTIDQRR